MNKLPTKADILQWITDNPTLSAKRDIAKAFGIKGQARIDLKAMLKELEAEGHLEKRKRTYADPDRLPPVSVVQVLPVTSDGDQFLKPLEWHGSGAAPVILYRVRHNDPALSEGDRILAKLSKETGEDYHYIGRFIRRIAAQPDQILGIYRTSSEGGRVVPIDKKSDREWMVPAGADHKARDGELVRAEQMGPAQRMGLPRARVLERLGDPAAPKMVSLIAIHQHGIPDAFPQDVLSDADRHKPAGLGARTDLRDLPLVTIDPSDARDHDDAVYAHADTDPKNQGGHVVWVAIADVAHYVTSGSALDREARMRGNSSYFPDRVVPMLPDRLSGDLCSLHEGVPRACIAVRMVIDAQGEKIDHSFVRGLMQSPASLHYEEVQAAMDGAITERTAPFVEDVIKPLYAAYAALKSARDRRQPLDLDLPERKVILTDAGTVDSIQVKARLDAHRLIEECMILANVAAAETLNAKSQPLLFRVHEEPNQDKLDALREVAQASGYNLAKGQVIQTSHLNRLLRAAQNTPNDELINMMTLRSMTQAYYSPENHGHFGLALRNYAHFTSPIRRYSDLIVHRALISAHGWGDDGLSVQDIERLSDTAKQISDTERRSMLAERDTTDRYLAAYLSEKVGEEFSGKVSGIAKFGLFVKLDDTGADGIVPLSTLGNEYFNFNAEENTLQGSNTGMVIALGMRVTVKLAEAVPVTGGIALEILTLEGKNMPKGQRRGYGRFAKGGRPTGGGPKRKDAKSKHKRRATERKVERKRRT